MDTSPRLWVVASGKKRRDFSPEARKAQWTRFATFSKRQETLDVISLDGGKH
jgi:hypothetical protein